MYNETNYIFYIKDFLKITKNGDNILPKTNTRHPNLISNPLLRSLLRVYRPDLDTSSPFNAQVLVDAAYSKLTGELLNFLKPELEKNQVYAQEVRRKLLNSKFGVFITNFSELFVGGYLKRAGFNISFNSSREVGKPDILTSGKYKVSHEIKSFPDKESWLEDTISSMMPEFAKLLDNYSNINLFAFVSRTEGFRHCIIKTVKELLDTGKGGKNEICWVVDMSKAPFQYAGSEGILISSPSKNSYLRFKVSFDAASETNNLFEKALKQHKQSKHKGITWMFFPHPKPVSIERNVIWLASEIPAKMMKENTGVVLFEINPTFDEEKRGLGVKVGVNFSIDPKYSMLLNKQSFDAFVDYLIHKPSFLIS